MFEFLFGAHTPHPEEPKEPIFTEAEEQLFAFGDAVGNFLMQVMKCDFVDEHGHPLRLNQAYINLAKQFEELADYWDRRSMEAE